MQDQKDSIHNFNPKISRTQEIPNSYFSKNFVGPVYRVGAKTAWDVSTGTPNGDDNTSKKLITNRQYCLISWTIKTACFMVVMFQVS